MMDLVGQDAMKWSRSLRLNEKMFFGWSRFEGCDQWGCGLNSNPDIPKDPEHIPLRLKLLGALAEAEHRLNQRRAQSGHRLKLLGGQTDAEEQMDKLDVEKQLHAEEQLHMDKAKYDELEKQDKLDKLREEQDRAKDAQDGVTRNKRW